MCRKIIHVDMDAFYAAVEQRDDPQLRGKPVVVGAPPNKRGVVSTCSYEARQYGIHSAMPSRTAYQLCPQAIFVRPRFEAYQEASEQIREIFYQYTDWVEPLSLDEAFLDVTEPKIKRKFASQMAREIREKIYQTTGLTASAGVSYNKFLAKIASDFRKPNGMTVIPPEETLAFLDPFPIGKFYGIGKATEKRMHDLGIYTGKDLRATSLKTLTGVFGKVGFHYYQCARGIYNSPVKVKHQRKSIGKETTFLEDVLDLTIIKQTLWRLAERIGQKCEAKNISGKTVTLKVRYADFTTLTRAYTVETALHNPQALYQFALRLLDKTDVDRRKVRLVGISLGNLIHWNSRYPIFQQLYLPFQTSSFSD